LESYTNVKWDFFLLEQYFLNTYVLDYNIRRIDLGAAPKPSLPLGAEGTHSNRSADANKGENNKQYGAKGINSAA
jgi:hypothetical protein